MLTSITRSSGETFLLADKLPSGETSNAWKAFYSGGTAVLKQAIDPSKNDRLLREMMMLRVVHDSIKDSNELIEDAHLFIPKLLDNFPVPDDSDEIIVNLMEYLDGFITLEDVHAAYPNGLDPRDMAWIYRRILTALSITHTCHVIHGAVVPAHILIHPKDHGLVLINWCASIMDSMDGSELRRHISSRHLPWYSPGFEVTTSLDLNMAAKIAIWLVGGDPINIYAEMPVGYQLRTLLRTHAAAEDIPAQDMHGQFDTLIMKLWGRRRYRELHMP